MQTQSMMAPPPPSRGGALPGAVVGGDSFDVRAVTDATGGTVDIIGGNGMWQGATGTGIARSRYADGPNGSYDYEFQTATP